MLSYKYLNIIVFIVECNIVSWTHWTYTLGTRGSVVKNPFDMECILVL